MRTTFLILAGIASLAAGPEVLAGQHEHPATPASAPRGWTAHWMAQVYPIITAGEPFGRETHLRGREAYLTQPALMTILESPGGRFALRTTLDLEQFSQPDGEYTFGGWGEGFIDKRHPHTLVHEFMLSASAWETGVGALSLSAGKGFAAYGTEDPMGRPVVKYPTNHHLSQVLERWTINGAWVHPTGWGLEGSVFGGQEPRDAYDFSNIESFGDSWSARLSKRFGAGAWEVSGSYARITESHGTEEETTGLANVAIRFAGNVGESGLYALLEASTSAPAADDEHGFWSVLAEAQLSRHGHQPYARFEVATRPEYHRAGAPGTPEFFRYEHGTHADGATRWVITTLGYGFTPRADGSPVSSRPFVELQHHYVAAARGNVDPVTLFGRRSLWTVSAGFRLFIGGGPMRMGSYGVLDPMAAGSTPVPAGDGAHAHAHP